METGFGVPVNRIDFFSEKINNFHFDFVALFVSQIIIDDNSGWLIGCANP